MIPTNPATYLPTDLLDAVYKTRHGEESFVNGINGLCALRDGAFTNKSTCKDLRGGVLSSMDELVQAMWDRHMEMVRLRHEFLNELYYTSVDSGPMLGAWLKRATKVTRGNGHSSTHPYGKMVAEIKQLIEWFAPISRDLLSKETLAKVQLGVNPAEKAARAEKRKEAEIASGKTVMTCACCWRGIAFDKRDGRMHHHGYERPGFGSQTASCMGVNYPPLEHSSSGVQAVLLSSKRQLATTRKRYNSRNEWASLMVMRRVRKEGGKPYETENRLVTIKRGTEDWASEFSVAVSRLQRDIAALKLDVAQRTSVLAAWHAGMDQTEALRVMNSVR